MDVELGNTEIRNSESDRNGSKNPDFDGQENLSLRNLIEGESRFPASRLPSAEFIKKVSFFLALLFLGHVYFIFIITVLLCLMEFNKFCPVLWNSNENWSWDLCFFI